MPPSGSPASSTRTCRSSTPSPQGWWTATASLRPNKQQLTRWPSWVPQRDAGPRSLAQPGLDGPPVVAGSRRTDSSLRVAARLVDLTFVAVETDVTGATRQDALDDVVARYGADIAAFIGNAGTTTAGSVDLAALGAHADHTGA